MRDCTEAEEKIIRTDICPFCGAHGFLAGPTGGMSMNVFCPNEECGAGFNINPVFTPELIKEPKNYGTLHLGGGKMQSPSDEVVVIRPQLDEISKFEALGWYWTTRKRKHWWSLRKSNVTVWGEFKRAPRLESNIPDPVEW